jgi:hypothetical protein
LIIAGGYSELHPLVDFRIESSLKFGRAKTPFVDFRAKEWSQLYPIFGDGESQRSTWNSILATGEFESEFRVRRAGVELYEK